MSNLLGRSCPTSSSNGGNNDDVDNLSPYELLRQERMRINAAKMLELGLVSRLERPSTAPKRAKLLAGQSVAKRRRGPAAPPLRSSPRLASTPAAPLSQPSAFPFSSSLRPSISSPLKSDLPVSLPSHIERAFQDDTLEAATPPLLPRQKANCLWDSRKLHAHVTLSTSRRTAATTGCAGYGCVLAACPTSDAVLNRNAAKYWEVEVVG
jgi:hypothetical protein